MFEFLNPQTIIPIVGLLGIGIIVFVEAGFLFGIVLPGDSLIFTASIFAAQGYFSIETLVIVALVSTILGDQTGYYLGKKFGVKIFNKEESILFKKSYIDKTKKFFDKYGKKAVLVCRFIPIVRTFIPTMAGISGMPYRDFVKYNILGAILWVSIFCTLGYFLGNIIGKNPKILGLITVAIIIMSVLSGVFMIYKNKKVSK